MKAKEVMYVRDAVEAESFDYAFVHYSDFENIKDEEFHKLRKQFLEARAELVDYCGLDNV